MRNSESALSTAAVARASSPSIHLLTVSLAEAGSKPFGSTAPFISEKRVAFHSLVAKLREPSTRADEKRRRPALLAASDAIVKRSASAPYLSISSSGSTTLPLDFDIFWPFSSV